MASDDWRKESGQDEVAGIIYSQKMNGYGKIYKLVVSLYCDPGEDWRPCALLTQPRGNNIVFCFIG